MAASHAARPACVEHEINLRNLQNHRRLSDSVLGLVCTVIIYVISV